MKLFVSFNFFSIMLDHASLTDAWGKSVLYRIKSLFINFGGAWSKQELFKGCSLWAGVNTFTFAGAEIEGGWGINSRYMLNPLAYVPLVGFNASYFEDYAREDLITNPLFTSMNDSRMHSTNVLNFVDFELRAKMLGDAIPAESFAVGANEISGFVNYNMQTDTPNGWPRVDSDDNAIWQHSDIKNVGVLSFSETDVVYGWRNGRYIVEDVKGGCRYEEIASQSLGAAHNFHIKIQTTNAYEPKALAAGIDSVPMFDNLSENVSNWLFCSKWNLMRITRRGRGSSFEWVSCDIEYSRFSVIVR